MMVRYLFATFHLITLATGIAAAYGRWRALQRVKSTTDLPAVFHADNWSAWRSASEKTDMVLMPIPRAERITRRAISPRLATSSFWIFLAIWFDLPDRRDREDAKPWPDLWLCPAMRLSTTLFVALSTLTLSAQIGRMELRTDSGLVVLHPFRNGGVSTKEWMDTDERFGLTTAYDRSGKEIFRYGTRRIGGHASVNFSYHPNGAVSKAEASDAPDAGIQWYRSTTTFDEQGNQTGFWQQSHEDLTTLRFHTGPDEPVLAHCQKLFTNEVFLVNATRQAGKANVKVLRPSPALKDSEHTLAPGDTVRLGSYSVGERFAAPETELTVDVRRVLRNRRKTAALGVVRTNNGPVNDTTQRWYLVVHHWARGLQHPSPTPDDQRHP
jgi:hypothetical protein